MNMLAFTLAGALTLSSGAAMAQTSARGVMPLRGQPTYAGVYDVATGTISSAPSAFSRGSAAPGVSSAIYRNDANPGTFYNQIDGRMIIDEGRIPSTSSPTVLGTQDSYGLTNIQIAYATDAFDPSVSGAGMTVEVNLYESFAACGTLETTDAAVASILITGMPGTTGGPGMGLAGFFLDVDVSSLGICMRADGDGVYSDGVSDRFGWSFRVVDAAGATAAGSLLAGDPAVALEGDGTAFQNGTTVPATGLDTVDAWRNIGATGVSSCFFFGGYPANPFSSFHLVIESDLAGDCIGCGSGDDRFEMNDVEMDAAPLALDSYSGLVSDVNEDWYSYTISPDALLTIDALFSDAVADLDLRIYDAMTGNQLDASNSGSDDEQVVVGNCDAMNGLDVTIQILNFSGVCNEYDLILAESSNADDALEDNDTCDMRVALPLGVTEGLIVRPSCGNGTTEDSDYYGYTLMPGDTLNVDILFIDAIADIDLILYDVTAGCNGISVSTGFTTSDNESVEFTNNTMGLIDMAVRVDFFSGSLNGYTMIASVGPNKLGEVICLGVNNSTLTGARLCALGDPVATANDLTLDVTDLPLNSMGYFVVSQDTNLVVNPGGSSGNLCIASLSMGRYAGDVLDSGATGAVTFSPDLTSIPIATGGGTGTSAAMAGDTYNYQYWYRDMDSMGAATSNFSDAIGIEFE